MGLKVTPTYATLILGLLEKKTMNDIIENRYGKGVFCFYSKQLYLFLLDDCFIIIMAT